MLIATVEFALHSPLQGIRAKYIGIKNTESSNGVLRGSRKRDFDLVSVFDQVYKGTFGDKNEALTSGK